MILMRMRVISAAKILQQVDVPNDVSLPVRGGKFSVNGERYLVDSTDHHYTTGKSGDTHLAGIDLHVSQL